MGLFDWLRKKPALDKVAGTSGRQHVGGFLDYDELNAALKGKDGLAVFDLMARSDPDVRRNIIMFSSPVVSGRWTVDPYGGDQATDEDRQIADDFAWALGIGEENSASSPCRPTWKGHIAQIAPVLMRSGFVPAEVSWTKAERVTFETPDPQGEEGAAAAAKDGGTGPGAASSPASVPAASSPPSPATVEAKQQASEQKKTLAANFPPPAASKPSGGAPPTRAAAPSAAPTSGPDTAGQGATDPATPPPAEPEPVAVRRTLLCPRNLGLRLPRTIEKWHEDDFGQLIAIEQFVAWRPTSTPDSSAAPNTTSTPGGKAWAALSRLASGPSGQPISRGRQYVTLAAEDLLYYRVGAEGDNWEGQSFLRPAYKPWLIKDKIERLDAIGQEREAVGVSLLYPPEGYHDQAALDDLDLQLADLRAGEQAHIRMPGPSAEDAGAQGWRLSIVGLGGEGAKRDPHASLQYHRDAIAASMAIEFMRLGQGSQGSKGALSTAKTQDDSFHSAVDAFAEILAAEANEKLATRFVALNYGPDKGVPTLKLAEADEQSLTDLITFVGPLLGTAIHPDDELEDYLRQRAGLPPASPLEREVRKQQAVDQQQADIEAAKAGAVPGEPPPKGEHVEKTTTTHAPGPDGKPQRSREKVVEKRKLLTDDPGAVMTLASRERRHWEGPTMEVAADALDRARDDMAGHLASHVRDLAAHAAHGGQENDPLAQHVAETIQEAFTHRLGDVYRTGRSTVRAELTHPQPAHHTLNWVSDTGGLPGKEAPGDHQTIHHLVTDLKEQGHDESSSVAIAVSAAKRFCAKGHHEWCSQVSEWEAKRAAAHALADGPEDAPPPGPLVERGILAAKAIASSIYQAVARMRLNGITDPATLAAQGEQAGDSQARVQAQGHSGGALNLGREDEAAQFGDMIRGARYTSILDGNRCDHCARADDGVLRALDDPVRLARKPPNPDCLGWDKCRCMEVFELNNETPAALDDGARSA